MVVIRNIEEKDYPLLKLFLYEAIFVPQGELVPPREIIELPELTIYYKGFGNKVGDLGVLAELDGQVIGMAWTRIIPDFGHIDNDTPSFSMSVLKEYRGRGIGTKLILTIFEKLREEGFKSVSLSVQKDNQAHRLYTLLGFDVYLSKDKEFIMKKTL